MPGSKVQCWNIFLSRISIQKTFSLLWNQLSKRYQSLDFLKNDFWKQQIVRQAVLEN